MRLRDLDTLASRAAREEARQQRWIQIEIWLLRFALAGLLVIVIYQLSKGEPTP